MLYAAIRVAEHSDIRLRNTKAYRAINDSELEYYVKNIQGINVVILEDFSVDKLEWVKKLQDETGIKCIVYSSLNDDTANILNEAGIHNLFGLENLQDYLCDTFHEDVLTHIRDGEVSIEAIESSDGSEFFEELEEASETNDKDTENKQEIDDYLDVFKQNVEEATRGNEEAQLSHNVTLKSKDDLKKDTDILLDEFESPDEIEDKTTSVSNEEIIRLNNELETAKSQLKRSLERIENLNSIKREVESERDSLKATIDEIISHNEVTEVVIGSLNRDEYEDKIKQLNSTIDELNLKVLDINQLSDRVENLKTTIEEKEGIERDLRAQIDALKNTSEVEILNDRIKAEVESRVNLVELVNNLIKSLGDTKRELANKQSRIDEILEDNNDMQSKYIDMQGQIKQLNGQIKDKDNRIREISNEFNIKIDNIVADSNAKETTISNLKSELKQALEDREAVNTRLKILQGKFRDLNEKLSQANLTIESQRQQIDGLDNFSIGDLNLQNEILGKTNDTMMGEIGTYQKRLDTANQKIKSNEAIMADLRKQIEDLKTTNASILNTSRLNSNIKFKCNYTGRANIILVCGSGSVGVTTTAVSICNKTRGKVLLIDLDLVSPKANAFLGRLTLEGGNLSPLIKDLPDIPTEYGLYRTGFGAFILKDIDYFINNESKVIKNIVKGKDGYRLDYIGGLYKKTSVNMFMSADFSQWMTYLGNSYDYIICDCGRVGGSELQSAMQRMLDSICFRKVLVANHDADDIRSLALRVGDEGLERTRDTLWVLNMAKGNEMTDLMLKCVSKAPYVIMPCNMDLYGSHITFDKVRNLSNGLEKLMNYIIQ